MRNPRLLALMVAGTLAVLTAGCGGTQAPPAGGPATAPTAAVAIPPAAPAAAGDPTLVLSGMTFAPKTVSIKVGTTVTFINQDTKNDHSVVEGDHKKMGQYTPLFKSADLATGERFAYTFDKPGTYPIFCLTDSHFLQGMVGTVEVKP